MLLKQNLYAAAESGDKRRFDGIYDKRISANLEFEHRRYEIMTIPLNYVRIFIC